MQYTQMRLLMYMMAYAVTQLAYTIPLVYMVGYALHLMANVVHPKWGS